MDHAGTYAPGIPGSAFSLTDSTDGRRFLAAIAVSVLIEAAAIGVLLPWISHEATPSDQPAPIKISVVQPPAPLAPIPKPVEPLPPMQAVPQPDTPPPPEPVPPTAQPVPPPLSMAMAPPPEPLQQTAPTLVTPPPPAAPDRVARRVVHHRPPPRHTAEPPVRQPPVEQPAVSPPAAPPAPSAGELQIFAAQMRRAVQAAAVNPDAAQLANERGTARISFTYFDGAISNVAVVASTGFPLLDRAAMEAARNAHYPPPPPDIAGHPQQILVNVVFN